jgi:zinc/manganese transport system substrate-binding protein/manganese/iron transport system substrate-binding protein
MRRTVVVGILLVLLAACRGGAGPAAPSTGDGDGLRVVATTTVLADLVANVGGDRVEVRSLVPAGGEVHTFDPSPGDIGAVAEADLVVMNGLGLDEWALELVEGSGTDATVAELAEDLDGVEYIEADEHEEGESEGHGHDGANPHLWLDVSYAALYSDRLRDALTVADPDGADAIEESAAAYRQQLEALHADITERMAAIPEPNRRIVSFHEAFPYFAQAYGLDVVGVVVESPGQDPSAGEIAALVEAIRDSGARAVFSEAQFNPRLAETIASEAGISVESGLHNDSLGEPPADTYIGMMELNAQRIEAALR